MGEQPIDVCGIDAYLTIVPIMSMTGGAEHACGTGRGNLHLAPAEQQRVRAATDLFRLFDEKLHGVLFGSGDEKTQAVEQATRGNAQGLAGYVLEDNPLDKFGGSGGRFESVRYDGVGISFSSHDLTSI